MLNEQKAVRNGLRCEVCRGRELTRLFNVFDYRLATTDEEFYLQQCNTCGHVLLSPKPDVLDLNSYYPQAFYNEGDVDFLSKINYVSALKKISRRVPKGKLLDVGCGSGHFLEVAKSYGYDVFGQEFSSEAVRIARKKHGDVIRNADLIDCRFDSDYFDVVSLWHVAEHVYDLDKYINEIRRILRPGGVLVLEVPNFSCAETFLFKQYSLFIEAPRHLRHFTKQSLKRLLVDAHFDTDLNSGWSYIAFPLSFLKSGRNWIFHKFKPSIASIIYGLVFAPLALLSLFNALSSLFADSRSVIGAISTKKSS